MTIQIRTLLAVFLILWIPPQVIGQKGSFGFTVSNSTVGFPVLDYPGVFYSQFHPGMDVRFRYELNDSERHRLYARMHMGFYYHRFVQTLVQAYPTLGYEFRFPRHWTVGAAIGAGYGLSFEGDRAFKKTDQGTYEQKAFFGARSQYLIAADFSGAYRFASDSSPGPSLVFGFRTLLQGTYVASYVPLIPVNSFYAGVEFPIVKK